MLFESTRNFGEILYSIQNDKIVGWKIRKITFCSDKNYNYNEYNPTIEYTVVKISEKYCEVNIREKDINSEFFWNKNDLIKKIDTTI